MASLEGLNPKVRQMTEELIKRCAEKGIKIIITQGLRTIAEQNALYAQGRTKPGKIVTNAKGGTSYHNYGLAVDFCLLLSNGSASWSMTEDTNNDGVKDWGQVASIAKSLGFEWGGDWKSFKDYPHFQYTYGLSISQLKAGKRPPTSVVDTGKVVTEVTKSPTSLRKGDKGFAVSELQKKLILVGEKLPRFGADGGFGDETVTAVKAFQARAKLVVDGIVGEATQTALQKAIDELQKQNAPEKPNLIVPYPGKVVKVGSTGIDVARVQRAVGVTPDEKFGASTEKAVKEYQAKHKLDADGIVGEKTWNMMF